MAEDDRPAFEGLTAEALAWCSRGEGRSRAEQLLTVFDAWPGPRAPMLREFLRMAQKTHAGRAAGVPYRATVPRAIPATYAAPAPIVDSPLAFELVGVDPDESERAGWNGSTRPGRVARRLS